MNTPEEITKKYIDFEKKISTFSPKKMGFIKAIFWTIVIILFFFAPAFAIGLIFLYFGIRTAIRHFAFMQKFAAENNLQYVAFMKADNLKGRLFSISNQESVNNVLIGKYNEIPIKIFNYTYAVSGGDSSQSYRFTVAEIEIEKTDFPFILLKSNSMPHYRSINLFKREKDVEISLEPELKKTYRLFTIKGYEIEALQIFTKDLLEFLKENGSHFSIEFAENKIYIYDDCVIRNEKDLSKLLDLTKKIIDKTAHFLNRMSDDFSALHSYYKK